MQRRKISWKVEWKAAGLDPGPLSEEEAALAAELEVENQAFLKAHPRRTKPSSRVLPLLWTAPLAAAVLLLVFLPSNPATPSGLERMKGGEPSLAVYRQAGKPERLSAQSVVRPGDVLQAAYQVSREVQGAIVSLDGNGQVTVHLGSGRSVKLVPGAEKFLDFGYELDRAPRYEVFLLLTSDKPFELAPVIQTLRQTPWSSLAPGAFGKEIRFVVLPLMKEVTP